MRSVSLLGWQVRSDPLWLLIFALVVVSLVTSAGSTGPATLPGPLALAVGVVVVVLLLACIVVHELAHALVAHRLGLRVTTIGLMTLGKPGTEAEPRSAGVDAMVAVSGPLVSGALGLALVGFPVLDRDGERHGPRAAGDSDDAAAGGPVQLVGIVTRRRVLERLRARQRLLDERARSAPGPARS